MREEQEEREHPEVVQHDREYDEYKDGKTNFYMGAVLGRVPQWSTVFISSFPLGLLCV